jgi:DNA-3-methyladenine glycosylase I
MSTAVSIGEIPAETAGLAMSRDLLARFQVRRAPICYALMQSAGLVNDHETGCYRWSEVQAAG